MCIRDRVFIAALIGATLAGIVGVLLAIPLASAGWTLGRDLIALRQARHAARMQEEGCGESEPLDPGPPPSGPPGAPAAEAFHPKQKRGRGRFRGPGRALGDAVSRPRSSLSVTCLRRGRPGSGGRAGLAVTRS